MDLKLHDIPNTVESAVKVLASVGADMRIAPRPRSWWNQDDEGSCKRSREAQLGSIRPGTMAVTQLHLQTRGYE